LLFPGELPEQRVANLCLRQLSHLFTAMLRRMISASRRGRCVAGAAGFCGTQVGAMPLIICSSLCTLAMQLVHQCLTGVGKQMVFNCLCIPQAYI
jgi:hypothetical protein